MTGVEVALVICFALVVAGFLRRRTTIGRWVMIAAATVLIGMLAIFGGEFLGDLL